MHRLTFINSKKIWLLIVIEFVVHVARIESLSIKEPVGIRCDNSVCDNHVPNNISRLHIHIMCKPLKHQCMRLSK